MFSCFSKNKNENHEEVLDSLRKIDKLSLKINLNDFSLNFNPSQGEWIGMSCLFRQFQ
jgi:hypothetical protein